MKKLLTILLCMSLMTGLCACGNVLVSNDIIETEMDEFTEENYTSSENIVANEDYFEWDENYIIALTDAGSKQKTIVVPARCEGFNGMIFADKENVIEHVMFESDNDIKLSGVFGAANKIKRIDLPEQLTQIEDLEFWLCSSLEEISIPASVKEIGKYAFQENTSLKKITFKGDLHVIKGHAFDGCSSLEKINIPNSVTTIEDYAFFGCMSLKNINLPSQLKKIGSFSLGNNGLLEITVPSDLVLEEFTTTSFVQPDHEVAINIIPGSWIDQNFEYVFDGAYVKNIIN